MKTAIVTGVTGQDGAWLSQRLLEHGYKVLGAVRRTSSRDFWRLKHLGIFDRVELVDLDLLEYSNIFETIKAIRPDEFYNLAAQSFVGVSFRQPISTLNIDGLAVAHILDILKTISPSTKFYQASTSEMFGKVNSSPQDEESPFHPRSPYGCAKLLAHWLTINYQESYGMYCCSGILFNHESQLRGPEFVTRKITTHVASRRHGQRQPLELGNLDARRDWGFAKDYVEGMHLMLQQERPDTFVLATGATCTVRRFVEMAFDIAGSTVSWDGAGVDEVGRDARTGETLVRVNPKLMRPAEVESLIGNPQKARERLGWVARTDVAALVEIMVKADLQRFA